MSGHAPVVVPMGGDTPTQRFVVQCPCGLNEQYSSEADANVRADDHATTGQ